jgi:hypothetical protein
VLLTEGTNVILAKNRYGLPAELDLSWPALMQAMSPSAMTWPFITRFRMRGQAPLQGEAKIVTYA